MHPPPKLLDQVRERLRTKHNSICTEQSYVDWIKRYILIHGKQHPKNLGARDLEAFFHASGGGGQGGGGDAESGEAGVAGFHHPR